MTFSKNESNMLLTFTSNREGLHMAKAPKNRETAKWDPEFTKQIAKTVGPLIKIGRAHV